MSRKRILRNLKLSAIAAVGRPCQEGAKAVIIKRAPDPCEFAVAAAKYYVENDQARTFAEVLNEQEFDRELWPMVDALSTSIRTIMGDKDLSGAGRETKITTSVDEFLSAVRSKAPAAAAKIESELAKTFKGDPEMKTVEQLTLEVAELTGQMTSAKAQITTLTAERDAQKTRADAAEAGKVAAEASKTAAEGELVTAKAALVAATDETISVGGQEIKKSVHGEAQFTVMKALAGERDIARLEKRAESEFGHVVGTPTEKAQVLRAIEAVPDEPTRKAAEAILLSAEKLAKAGFDRLGMTDDQIAEVSKAVGDFDAKVDEIVKRDSIPKFQAMQKARNEHPALFEAMREAQENAPVAN